MGKRVHNNKLARQQKPNSTKGPPPCFDKIWIIGEFIGFMGI
jgi:hypothetical protein